MTYLAFEAREVTPEVLNHPELAQEWKQAAQHNLIKSGCCGRYSVVLDMAFAERLRSALPGVTCYNYDDGADRVEGVMNA
ncbi:hypothetical protein [Deinococcus pimensis]|uniref:hypothetical protein n=1 Tax=Deinococcus pimensis TaxID=309888 RepID=UPI0004B410E0|nr:hypothetical protein [Deinococcus pimensis]